MNIYKDAKLKIIDGKLVVKGTRNTKDSLWDITIPNIPTQALNTMQSPISEVNNYIIWKDKTKTDLAIYIHAYVFSPPMVTLQNTIKKGYFCHGQALMNNISQNCPKQYA